MIRDKDGRKMMFQPHFHKHPLSQGSTPKGRVFPRLHMDKVQSSIIDFIVLLAPFGGLPTPSFLWLLTFALPGTWQDCT